MQLIIKISDTLKEILDSHDIMTASHPMWVAIMMDAIENGTPLPEGHGDLKDESDLDLFAPSLGTDEYIDDLMAKHNIDYINGDDEDKARDFALDLIHGCMNVIKTAPTIIKANIESEDQE